MGHLFSSSEETRYYWLEHQNEDFGAYIWRDAIRRSSEARSRLTFQETWLADGFCRRKRNIFTLLDCKTSIYRITQIAVASHYRFQPDIFHHERFYLNLAAFLRMVVFFKILGFFIKVVFFFEIWRTMAFFHLNPEKKAEIKTFWTLVLWLWYFGPDQPKISEKEVRCHLFLL